MKNISYRKTGLNKVTVKGVLSDDCTTITYEDDEHNAQTVDVIKCMKPMGGNTVTLTVALKSDEDCSNELTMLDEED